MVKLYTNKISVSGGKGFQDFVDKVTGNKETQKQASSDEPKVKTAEADEAETSGKPQAEAKLVNVPEKDEGKGKGSKGADNSEAETSGQPQAEAKLVNVPKVEASEETEVKEAAGKCEECGNEPCDCCTECKKSPCECNKEAETTGVETKEAETKEEEEVKEEEEKKEEVKDAKKEPGFVRLAKLNPQTRKWLADYWKNLYPADYVDAMLAEN